MATNSTTKTKTKTKAGKNKENKGNSKDAQVQKKQKQEKEKHVDSSDDVKEETTDLASNKEDVVEDVKVETKATEPKNNTEAQSKKKRKSPPKQEEEEDNKSEENNDAKEDGKVEKVSTALLEFKKRLGEVEPENTTVSVIGFPPVVMESHFKTFFRPCGTISAVKINRNKTTGRPFFPVFVRFATAEAAQKAIELSGQQMLDKQVQVRPVVYRDLSELKTPKVKHSETRTVGVYKLNRCTDEYDLRNTFDVCGEIEHIKFIEPSNPREQFKHAFVLFKDHEGSDNAMLMNGVKILGHPADLTRAKKNLKVEDPNMDMHNNRKTKKQRSAGFKRG